MNVPLYMRAYLVEKAGGPDVLELKSIDRPVITDSDVLVQSRAIGINPADFKVRSEEQGLDMAGGGERPVILGWDIAGVVVQVGGDVVGFKEGDRVFGMVNFPGAGKAYAEYVASPATHLAKIPDNIGFNEAAATTLAALTAYQVLNENINHHDRVLIHAGSGGVGHFAVQIAKNSGAHVIATCSAKNRDFVLSIGADEHIDYRTQKFDELLDDINFVFDTVGGQTMIDSVNVLAEGGQLTTVLAFEPPPELVAEAAKRNATVKTALVQSNGADMSALAQMLGNQAINPTIAKLFEFTDMPKAHAELERGRTVGKIVIAL